MTKHRIKIITAVLVMAIVSVFTFSALADASGLEEVEVSAVVDGDTIVLEDGRRVRLIGINAPEVGEPTSQEATDYVIAVALGETVWLESDGEDFDNYGRLRRYVWLREPADVNSRAEIETKMLNALLLKNALAEVMIVGEVRHEELFRSLGRPLLHEQLQPGIESPFEGGEEGFTHDGDATVVDNVVNTEGNGKEFFAIETDSGSVFYLILDRQRSSDNVYFLSPVTEWELIALAEDLEISPPPHDFVMPPPVQSEAREDPDGGVEEHYINGSGQIEESGDRLAMIFNVLQNNLDIVLVAGFMIVFGLGFYFLKVRKKKDKGEDND